MKRAFLPGFLFLLQPAPAAEAERTQWMDVAVERRQADDWKTADPGTVFQQGDAIRFRFRANFSGYLYVINRGSSGTQMLLFPREETGKSNHIQTGKDYLVPATETAFRIDGPAGYDSVYWLVSPVSLNNATVNLPANVQPTKAANLTPRCDPAQLRARGFCIDADAGPRNLPDIRQAPDAIARTPGLQARELTIIQGKDKTRLSPGGMLTGPTVYEFRIAHQ